MTGPSSLSFVCVVQKKIKFKLLNTTHHFITKLKWVRASRRIPERMFIFFDQICILPFTYNVKLSYLLSTFKSRTMSEIFRWVVGREQKMKLTWTIINTEKMKLKIGEAAAERRAHCITFLAN